MNKITEYFRKAEFDEMLDLSIVEWPQGIRVLVLAPHSDDFDAMAITMKNLQQANAVIKLNVLSLDSGVEPDFEPQTPQAEIRKREQLESLAFFGFDEKMVTFTETACDQTGQTEYHPENREIIKELVTDFMPNIIFTTHQSDDNSAHKSVAKMLYECNINKETLIFHIQDPKTREIRPDAFTPFNEEQAIWKAELLRHHKSQHSRNLNTRGFGFDRRVIDVNRQNAMKMNLKCNYVELFEVKSLSN